MNGGGVAVGDAGWSAGSAMTDASRPKPAADRTVLRAAARLTLGQPAMALLGDAGLERRERIEIDHAGAPGSPRWRIRARNPARIRGHQVGAAGCLNRQREIAGLDVDRQRVVAGGRTLRGAEKTEVSRSNGDRRAGDRTVAYTAGQLHRRTGQRNGVRTRNGRRRHDGCRCSRGRGLAATAATAAAGGAEEREKNDQYGA